LIEASLDSLVTISADGKITDVNEAAIKLTGVPRDKLIGTNFSNCSPSRRRRRKPIGRDSRGILTDYP